MAGRAYEGVTRDKATNQRKCVTRKERKITPREGICTPKRCKNCHTISDPDRLKLFHAFWKMTWEQRKVYVCSLVSIKDVVRRRQPQERSRRNNTLNYHLTINGETLRVCKGFFLGTIAMNEWSIRKWSLMGYEDNTVTPKKKVEQNTQST